MPNQFEYVDLTGDSLHIGYVYDSLFLQDLYSDFLSSESVRGQLHLPEGALPYGFANQVVADLLGACRSLHLNLGLGYHDY